MRWMLCWKESSKGENRRFKTYILILDRVAFVTVIYCLVLSHLQSLLFSFASSSAFRNSSFNDLTFSQRNTIGAGLDASRNNAYQEECLHGRAVRKLN